MGKEVAGRIKLELYPVIKFTSSFPGIPLRLQVSPLLASAQLIMELQQCLLVELTGQVNAFGKHLPSILVYLAIPFPLSNVRQQNNTIN